MDKIGTDYTSYKDLKGVISIDFAGDPGKTDFNAYVSSLGINLKRYRPFGAEIYAIESSDVINEGMVRILAYDAEDDNKIVRFDDIDTFKTFLGRVWRLSITITEDGYKEGDVIKLNKEIGE